MKMNINHIFSIATASFVFLSTSIYGQEDEINIPKSNAPIEAKEQTGTVLGSLQKIINQIPIPTVTVNTGFQTKQFKRGVMWDQNTNADIDVNLSWQPTENSSLSIGINGRAPTRNSKRKYVESKLGKEYSIPTDSYTYHEESQLLFWPFFNNFIGDLYYSYGDRYKDAYYMTMEFYELDYKETNFSSKRDSNELDEKELNLAYTYTFKDVPLFDNISISGGWSYFKENSIYSRIIPTFRGSIMSLRDNYLQYVELVDRYYNALTEGLDHFEQRLYEGGSFWDILNNEPYFINKNDEIEMLFDEIVDHYIKSDYDYILYRKIKWRDTTRNEFKLSFSLDNILHSNVYILNPNMSINFETNGHLWLQYGINFNMPLAKISNKLLWNTSIETFWFDHDYFKVSDRYIYSYYQSNRDFTKNFYRWGIDKEWLKQYKKNFIEKELKEQLTDIGKKQSYTAHSQSGFKTLSLRTSLDYALRPNIILSPNISAIRYLDGLLEHSRDNEIYYFNEHYALWCGINLLFTF